MLERLLKNPVFRFFLGVLGLFVGWLVHIRLVWGQRLAVKINNLFSPHIASALIQQLFTRNELIPEMSLSQKHVRFQTALKAFAQFNLKDYVQSCAFSYGLPDFFKYLLFHASKDSLFFEIGANHGLISVGMSEFIPPGQIFAFEAIPATFERLVATFQINCPSAHAINIALSDTHGKLQFTLPSSDSGSASASIDHDTLLNCHRQKNRITQVTVDCITFDEFYTTNVFHLFEKPASFVFKIDTEGHELHVLKGMQSFLGMNRGIFLAIEVSTNNLIPVNSLLLSLGFQQCYASEDEGSGNGRCTDLFYLKC